MEDADESTELGMDAPKLRKPASSNFMECQLMLKRRKRRPRMTYFINIKFSLLKEV